MVSALKVFLVLMMISIAGQCVVLALDIAMYAPVSLSAFLATRLYILLGIASACVVAVAIWARLRRERRAGR
jgi:hypothetical protein